MSTYTVPDEWKSPVWWRNRPLDERLFHMHVPIRYTHAHVAEVSPAGLPFASSFAVGDNLLIFGPAKSGKTTQAVAIATYALRENLCSVKFIDADDYVEMVKDSFDDGLGSEYSTPYLLKYIKGVFDVVVLDALGFERQTDFARHEIGTLIRHRHDHGLSTIITSHLRPMDIARIYGPRVGAALEEYQTQERVSVT